MMRCADRLPVALLLLIAKSSIVAAEFADAYSYRPDAVPVRIGADRAPVIDGDLSDDVWLSTPPITTFYQSDPVAGAPPSEDTAVMIVHDGENIYVGAILYVSRAGDITATIQERDGELWDDDQFRIQFDTYDTGRDAYGFMVNPLGSRYDYLVENNTDINAYWNTIWSAKTSRRADRWTAEIVIPLDSLPHDRSAQSWGLQIVRVIRKNNEVVRWSAITQSLGSIDMSIAGRLHGIEGETSGRGLDVQGFVRTSWDRQSVASGFDDTSAVEPSANVFYRITPSLTGTLTVNTDFSDTPLDSRQVNTSRFSLFFPEVREFFLQDAAVFQFGGANFQNDVNGTPFFSRRIGIVDGQPVDIGSGVKLSGSVGRTNIGVLTVRTKDADLPDAPQLTSVRFSAEVLAESRLGLVVTDGDPAGLADNSVFGADFLYRNSHIRPGRQYLVDTFYLASNDDALRDEAYGINASSTSDAFAWHLAYKYVGRDFRPRLGFVNRAGTRRYDAGLTLTARPADNWVAWASLESGLTIYRSLAGKIETSDVTLQHCGESRHAETWCLSAYSTREVIDELFLLPGEVPVAVGDYRYARLGLQAKTSTINPVTLNVACTLGDYFDGSRQDIDLIFESRLSRFIRANIEYALNRIRLPSGGVDIRIVSMNVNLNFTPEMQFASQIQHDNISRRLSYFGRFSWEFRPESELFLSLSQDYLGEPGSFRSEGTGLTFRIGNTFRF